MLVKKNAPHSILMRRHTPGLSQNDATRPLTAPLTPADTLRSCGTLTVPQALPLSVARRTHRERRRSYPVKEHRASTEFKRFINTLLIIGRLIRGKSSRRTCLRIYIPPTGPTGAPADPGDRKAFFRKFDDRRFPLPAGRHRRCNTSRRCGARRAAGRGITVGLFALTHATAANENRSAAAR